MRVPEMLFFYVLAGLVVAGLAYRRSGEARAVTAVLWPLWLPALLAPPTDRYDTAPQVAPQATTAPPEVARLRRLLDAWAPELSDRCEALSSGLEDLDLRVRALQSELDRPENALDALRTRAKQGRPESAVHRRHLANIQALLRLRDRLTSDRAMGLAQVDELSSRVQLARFQGGSAEGLGRELADLVAAIDGAREAAGQVPSTLPA